MKNWMYFTAHRESGGNVYGYEGTTLIFSLYLQEEYWFGGSLWLVLLLLYGNTIFS